MAGCFFFGKASAETLPEDTSLKLSSGHAVKVLSISKIWSSNGVPVLMVRYQTRLSLDERKELSQEVDEVWKSMEKEAESRKVSEVIISSNEVPRGIIVTANRMLNFIFEKDSEGKWSRLNRSEFLTAQSGR